MEEWNTGRMGIEGIKGVKEIDGKEGIMERCPPDRTGRVEWNKNILNIEQGLLTSFMRKVNDFRFQIFSYFLNR